MLTVHLMNNSYSTDRQEFGFLPYNALFKSIVGIFWCFLFFFFLVFLFYFLEIHNVKNREDRKISSFHSKAHVSPFTFEKLREFPEINVDHMSQELWMKITQYHKCTRIHFEGEGRKRGGGGGRIIFVLHLLSTYV